MRRPLAIATSGNGGAIGLPGLPGRCFGGTGPRGISHSHGLPGEITDEGIAALGHYDWPGNIRELRNLLERALTMREDDGLLDAESIFKVLPAASAGPEPRMSLRRVRPLARVMAEAEAHAIEEALLACRGNRTRAARLLGISRSVLYEKLARMS